MPAPLRLRSKLFIPFLEHRPALHTAREHALLLQTGFVRQTTQGCFALLPLGYRLMQRLEAIIRHEMDSHVGAEQLMLPAISNIALWQKSERWAAMRPELFALSKQHLLGPTFEEEMTTLVAAATANRTVKSWPLALYQITSKYRNEARPRGGLLRGREFVMKDLYTFDTSLQAAEASYATVCQAYTNIFDKIGLPYEKAKASNGAMGGVTSHEWSFLSTSGEDTVGKCQSCGEVYNAELVKEKKACISCGSVKTTEHKAIEVGHTFLLGTRYAETFGAHFVDEENKPNPLVMGCYGIGVSRLIAAIAACSHDETGLRWPVHLAPYPIAILQASATPQSDAIEAIRMLRPQSELMLDDRTDVSLKVRVTQNLMMGIPYLVIVGKSWQDRKTLDVIRRSDRKDWKGVTMETLSAIMGIENSIH